MRLISPRLRGAAISTLAFAVLLVSSTTPASAATGNVGQAEAATPLTSAMSATVLVLLNRDRAALGLPALHADGRLTTLAVERARRMAESGILSHVVAGGDIGRAVRACGVRASLAGETIGLTNAMFGRAAARYLYQLWKHSPTHWSLLVSGRFD